MTADQTPSGESPGGEERPGWLERVTPRRVDLRSALLLPVLSVLSALIIGAVIIGMTAGWDEIVPAYGALLSLPRHQPPNVNAHSLGDLHATRNLRLTLASQVVLQRPARDGRYSRQLIATSCYLGTSPYPRS